MVTEKFLEVLGKEGVVSIVSCANNEAHVVNTWNSYMVLKDGKSLLIPVYGMRKTEKNVVINSQVKLTLGSKEVQGFQSMGTGFLVTGTARFISNGPEFDQFKAKYSWLTRLLEVEVATIKQTL